MFPSLRNEKLGRLVKSMHYPFILTHCVSVSKTPVTFDSGALTQIILENTFDSERSKVIVFIRPIRSNKAYSFPSQVYLI